MKPIKLSPAVLKRIKEIQKTNIKLSDRIQKQLKTFQENPRHPSLRLHRITREVKNTWSISIDINLRMLYTETEKEYYFFDIGTHDEVYR